ncbi:MAG: hypothetical protein NTW03_06060 [Verrucomicrobia bacterium]|nr:hypothetical protein [Verrucomicrobiota bacterium]
MSAQLQLPDPIHVRDFLIIGGFLLSAGTGARRTEVLCVFAAWRESKTPDAKSWP